MEEAEETRVSDAVSEKVLAMCIPTHPGHDLCIYAHLRWRRGGADGGSVRVNGTGEVRSGGIGGAYPAGRGKRAVSVSTADALQEIEKGKSCRRRCPRAGSRRALHPTRHPTRHSSRRPLVSVDALLARVSRTSPPFASITFHRSARE